MRRIGEIALAASVACVLVNVSGSHAAEDKFTMQIDKVIVEPGGRIQQGQAAVVRCHWSAKLLPGLAGIDIKAQTAKAATALKRFDRFSKPGNYKAESPLKGEFKAEWIPDAAGSALVTCFVVGPSTRAQTARAEKSLPVVVTPASVQVASPQAAPQVASPQTAKGEAPTGAWPSKLEIVQAAGAPTADCGAMSGHFLTMKLTIKNSGKPLRPDHGIVRIRGEYGTHPDNLSFSSGDVSLPEIQAGPANVIEVPVNFANFKREKLSMLAGTTRQFEAELLPKPSGTFPHVKGFSFPVSFPKGLCATAAAQPVASAAPPASVPSTQRAPSAARAPETTPGPAPPPSISTTPRR